MSETIASDRERAQAAAKYTKLYADGFNVQFFPKPDGSEWHDVTSTWLLLVALAEGCKLREKPTPRRWKICLRCTGETSVRAVCFCGNANQNSEPRNPDNLANAVEVV